MVNEHGDGATLTALVPRGFAAKHHPALLVLVQRLGYPVRRKLGLQRWRKRW